MLDTPYSSYQETARKLQRQCYDFLRKKTVQKTDAKIPISLPAWRTVAQWLLAHKRGKVTTSTWCLYRNAVKHVSGDPEVIRLLSVPAGVRRRDIPRRGSSLRQKHLKARDLAQIERWINERRLRYGRYTAIWLKATILTGLRPSEWRRAELLYLDRDTPVLEVVNAKKDGADNSGLPDLYDRRIPLDHLDETDQAIIQTQLDAAKLMDENGVYDKFMKGCQNVLYRAVTHLWPRRGRRPNLYSARHQFTANCKARGLSKAEIAVLMGHSSENTAKNHYGRTACGEPGAPRGAWPEDLETFNGRRRQSGGGSDQGSPGKGGQERPGKR